MLGKFGAEAAVEAVFDNTDARSMALALMSSALGHLDSDTDIPPFIGAHLQTAIDALWASISAYEPSIHLH